MVGLKQFKRIREMFLNDRLDEINHSRIYNFPRIYNIETFNIKVAQRNGNTVSRGNANNLSHELHNFHYSANSGSFPLSNT